MVPHAAEHRRSGELIDKHLLCRQGCAQPKIPAWATTIPARFSLATMANPWGENTKLHRTRPLATMCTSTKVPEIWPAAAAPGGWGGTAPGTIFVSEGGGGNRVQGFLVVTSAHLRHTSGRAPGAGRRQQGNGTGGRGGCRGGGESLTKKDEKGEKCVLLTVC